MCGIVAALPSYGGGSEDVSERQLLDAVPHAPSGTDDLVAVLDRVLKQLAGAAEVYALPAAGHRLVCLPALRDTVTARLASLDAWLDTVDAYLDRAGATWDGDLLETAQGIALRARDLVWALGQDRVAAAGRAAALAGTPPTRPSAATTAYLAVDAVLDAVNRLEVRGRDSAGVQLWITLDEADRAAVPAGLRNRSDADYRHGAVEFFATGLAVVYKRASIIGRLGENVAFLRDAIAADGDLHTVLALPSARVFVLAHTRWASVGRISEANAHPVNSGAAGPGTSYSTAVLNGDIDNHVDLRERLKLPADSAGISTDAQVIPVMVAREVAAGAEPADALATAVRGYHGSFAIATQTDAAPEQVLLAVKGSGQGLYVGLAPECFLVASEVYGLVGLTDRYVRLDGTAEDGTVVALDRTGAGTLAGLRRLTGAGRPVPLTPDDVLTAEITTRDVARGPFDHYLVKEITEAPTSFRKSLRGRIATNDGRLSVHLSESALPRSVRDRFAAGELREIIFVGQGTAAVACRGIAAVVKQLLHPAVSVDAQPATELSVWGLRKDMSDVCLVAVSQSGTTTDTNRAVDMARARGAAVLSVVNRRDSDLAHKSDGVLYTSDGRDVEMAVASTKAFYSQVATGAVLGLQIARVLGRLPADLEHSLLDALVELPQHLEALQALTPRIAEIADLAVRYPYWAVVGSGPNRVAADEARIKLSELCYKTISTDAVEDKKHIDLSAEALVVICAAGAPASQLRDLAKEVDIFAAHRNAPVVIVDEGIDLPWATEWVIRVPVSHPVFAWILSTAAGHLLAYHAARAIDRRAEPLREALGALEATVDAGRVTIDDLDRACDTVHGFVADAAKGSVRGVLGSDTAVRLTQATQVLRHAGSTITADPVGYLREQLTAAIDELTRSIDSVKHQAKTVTVGTSRGDSDLLDNAVTAALVEVGGDPAIAGYATLLALRGYARVISSVAGATRYQVGWHADRTTLKVTRKTGSVADLPSRADTGADLSGSKRLAVQSRAVRLVRGARDGRLVLMIPEQAGARVQALTVLHVALSERAEAAHLAELLDLTGTRLDEIRAAVTETDRLFDPALLALLPVETVLLAPVTEVADQALTAAAPTAATATAPAATSSE